MKRLSKWMGVIMVLCCVWGLSLTAQAENKMPNYVVLKGGIYSPQTDNLDGFNTGFNGEVAYGRYFDKNWSIEAGLGYFETSSRNATIVGPDFTPRSVRLRVAPVTVAFKGTIPVDRFEFYGLGGIGAYGLETDIDRSSRGRDHDRDSETLFGGFLGLGALFNATPRLFIGLEGKYLWTTKSSFIDAETDLSGIQATFNVGFRF